MPTKKPTKPQIYQTKKRQLDITPNNATQDGDLPIKPKRAGPNPRLHLYEDLVRYFYLHRRFTLDDVRIAIELMFQPGATKKQYERYAQNLKMRVTLKDHEWKTVAKQIYTLQSEGFSPAVRIEGAHVVEPGKVKKNLSRALTAMEERNIKAEIARKDREIETNNSQLTRLGPIDPFNEELLDAAISDLFSSNFLDLLDLGSLDSAIEKRQVLEVFVPGLEPQALLIPYLILNRLPIQAIKTPLLRQCQLLLRDGRGEMMQLSQVADSRYFQYLRRLIYIISNRLCFDEEIDHLLDMVSKFGYWRALKSILSLPAVATNSVCKRIIPNLILRGDFELVDHIIKCHPSLTQRFSTPSFQGKFYQLEICTKPQGNPFLVPENVLAASRSDFDGLDNQGSREGWPRRYSQKIAASTCIRSIFRECPPISSAAEAVILLAGAIVSRKTNVDEILRIFDYRRAIDAVSQSFKDVYETVVVKFAFENTPNELDPTETFALLTMLDELGFWSQICLYLFTSSTDTALAESQRAALLEYVLFRNSQIFGGYDVLATNIHDIIQIPVDEIDTLFYDALSARSSQLEHEWTASEAQALVSECLGTVSTSSSILMQLCTELLVSASSHEKNEVRDFLLNYYQHRYPETYQLILNMTFSLTLESTYLSDTVYNRPVIYLFRKPGTILSIWRHLLDIGAIPITLTTYENKANRLPQSLLEQILLRGDLDLAQKLVEKAPSSFCNLHKDKMMDVIHNALQQSDSKIFTTLLQLRKDEVAMALLEHQDMRKRDIRISPQFQAAVSDCDIKRIIEMWDSRAIYTAAPDSRQLTFDDNNINLQHANLLSSLGALVRFYTPDNKKLVDSITKLAGSIGLVPSIRHLFYNIRAVADSTGEIITEKINIIQALASIGDAALIKNIISAHPIEAREFISAKYPFAPSPLICAIRLESLSSVKLLVQNGANLNDYEDLDCTYLIDDPDVQWGCPLDVWEVRERSPLSCATLIGNLAIVKYLLEHGAKPDKVCVETAVAYERLDTLSLFLNFDFRLQEFAMDYASSNLDPFEGDHILGFIKEFGSLKGKEVAPSEAVMGRPAIEEGEEERG